jgi:hypothetical protein
LKEGVDSLQKIALLLNNLNPDTQLEEGKKLSKKHLINTLNYINFQDGTILINFKHLKYENILSLQAKPQPCLENTLDCRWIQTEGLSQKLRSYKFLNFLINDGQKMILVKADVRRISEEGINFDLPETCYGVGFRKVKRYPCEGIQAELIQNGLIFSGVLLDFSAVSFRIEISTEPPQSFQFINPESTVHIVFKNGKDTFYSGECRIIRQTFGQKTRTFVLEPVNDKICRFKHKEYRSSRHKLLPSPSIIFRHPFTRKMVTLEVDDLSGSGFSVEEYHENSVLLPGMIIPELYIEIAHNVKIRCKVQVVYRNAYKTYEDEMYAKCGVAILDMDIQDQVILSSLLHQVANKKSYVCNTVDLDALWKFFFEVGFVYPEKYAFIHANKEKFKETYEKLYIQSPTIARHFIYQDRGIIQGHMSMVRFYENTWLFHHHAATGAGFSRAGLVVLDQIGRYVNDFYCLYSTHMNFVICYFRPENRFPNRVFGGYTRSLNNPKGSSLDTFAYVHFLRTSQQRDMRGSWTLMKTQPEDLSELQSFYEYKSGGLMLHALDLTPDMTETDEINKEYEKFGFKRARHLFSLKKENNTKAVFMVTLSNVGLNFSNLTNCIHVFVLNSENLPSDILYAGLSQLSHYYEQEEIPILLYPVGYAETQSIDCEKLYNLWVLNIPHAGDQYLKYIENLFTRTQYE